ncbi:hypothetical protein HDU87_000695 [Geranomyces variabilis]|uniref:Aminoglycoside phosphotransferase domain-containing protein n=1 Tax=Geranomyces variabilis TaxID=109894 RepID=A0AAD5TN61_9FUNG|nr:hypothetical protein HDU87_000695 [Geranomyces variabilis]
MAASLSSPTAGMDEFDFAAYLQNNLQGGTTINVDRLAGGGNNLTVRASFSPAARIDNALYTTIVLKYAPPYIASRPEIAASVYRQTVEARALALLSKPKTSLLGAVRFPRLIKHDEAANVLWMTDLAEMTCMAEWLALPKTTPALAAKAGAELGRSLANFWTCTRNPSVDLVARFRTDRGPPPEIVAQNCATVFRLLDEVVAAPDAVELTERYKDAYKSPEPRDNCLGIADLWMGSVLLGKDGEVALCDWEFFGQSDAGAELGMLLGSIRSFTLTASTPPSARIAASSFVVSLLASYTSFDSAEHNPGFLRRLLLAYVREVFCHEDEFEGKVRQDAIQSWTQILRAAGPEGGQVTLKLISEQETEFLKGLW